jgi:hypothetical protein
LEILHQLQDAINALFCNGRDCRGGGRNQANGLLSCRHIRNEGTATRYRTRISQPSRACGCATRVLSGRGRRGLVRSKEHALRRAWQFKRLGGLQSRTSLRTRTIPFLAIYRCVILKKDSTFFALRRGSPLGASRGPAPGRKCGKMPEGRKWARQRLLIQLWPMRPTSHEPQGQGPASLGLDIFL